MVDGLQDALDILGKAGKIGSSKPELEVIPTDIPEFNEKILGCGGIPRGKIIEMYAKESVGKSTLAYWLLGQAQKAGGVAALFDAEGAYLPDYGAKCGINNDELILVDFDLRNDALFKIQLLLATNAVDLIVVDSMPALQPALVAEKTDASALKMNERLERAKMFTVFFNEIMGGYKIKSDEKGAKFITQIVDGKKTTIHKMSNKKAGLIFINHAKDKIGVMFGQRTYTPGGDAINFASSIRLGMNYLKKSKKKDENDMPIFKHVKVTAAKNKLAPPLMTMEMKLWRDGRVEALEDWVEEEVEDPLDAKKKVSELKGVFSGKEKPE